MPNIPILCLANSRKLGGRCIAGINLETGQWIRPVRDNGGALTVSDVMYKDGSIPQVLDVINVPLMKQQPLYYQPENWVIDPNRYWEKIGKYPIKLLNNYCDNKPYIFANGIDRLTEHEVKSMAKPYSLILIKVTELCLEKRWPVVGSSPKLRAKFTYNLLYYDLAVTDILLEEKFLRRDVALGEYHYQGIFLLTISLGEPFNGEHFKLVTSIIRLDRTETFITNIQL